MPNNLRLSARRLLLAGIVTLPFAFTGCVSTIVKAPNEPVDTSNLVWPGPPDPARVAYVTSLRSQSLLSGGKKEETGSLLKNMLLGVDKNAGSEDDIVINKPYGVHADNTGRVFVTDTDLNKLLVFDLKAKKVSVWGDEGKGRLRKPIGVTSDSTGRIFVTDATDKRVVIFDRNGKFLYAWNAGGSFVRPTGIAIDEARERVYVIDTSRHNISVLDMRGTLITTLGSRGVDPGQFSYPTNLAVGPKGRLYVVDSLNHRVQIMKPDGSVVKTFGRNGDAPGSFSRPKGIALDSDGNIYVVDAAFGNVQIFDQEGNILLYVGVGGGEPGQFQLPAGAYMAKDRLYVADQLNSRIQIFKYLKLPTEEKPKEEKPTAEKKAVPTS